MCACLHMCACEDMLAFRCVCSVFETVHVRVEEREGGERGVA